jgi:uncharacterized protein YvpB
VRGRAVTLTLLACAAACGCASNVDPSAARTAALASRLEGRPQARSLSCESRSACDLLAAHGRVVAEEDFLARLPRDDDPERGFVGDVDAPGGGLPPEGYGVHAPPVAATLRGFGLDARAERGRDLAWLRAETEAGRPVIAWTTYGCRPGRREEVTLPDGRRVAAVRWEHAVLVIAVRGGRVSYVDPAWGEVRRASEAEFDASWALFDRAAVSATGALARGDVGR